MLVCLRLRACMLTKLLPQTLNATVRFPLLDERGKPIKVFTTGAQKLFLLLQDALSDAPSDVVSKTHSLRSEVDVRANSHHTAAWMRGAG